MIIAALTAISRSASAARHARDLFKSGVIQAIFAMCAMKFNGVI